MRKGLRTILLYEVLFVLIAFALVGCNGGTEAAMDSFDNSMITESVGTKGDYLDFENESPEKTEAPAENEGSVSTNRKIIKTFHMSVQTKEFDALVCDLEAEIEKIGGYIEFSSLSGHGFNSDKGNRYADFTIRVPANKSDSFTVFVSENSTVTNKELKTEDITLSYVDIESRVNALRIEKSALESLLSNAGDISDVITIRDRLTDVIYEIESHESRLRTYDNLVEYVTIHLSISEVERVDITEKQTVWEEIRTKIKRNIENIKEFFVDLFIFIVGNIPYIALFATLSSIIYGLIVLNRKRKE